MINTSQHIWPLQKRLYLWFVSRSAQLLPVFCCSSATFWNMRRMSTYMYLLKKECRTRRKNVGKIPFSELSHDSLLAIHQSTWVTSAGRRWRHRPPWRADAAASVGTQAGGYRNCLCLPHTRLHLWRNNSAIKANELLEDRTWLRRRHIVRTTRALTRTWGCTDGMRASEGAPFVMEGLRAFYKHFSEKALIIHW